MKINYEKLHRFCEKIFQKYGFNREDSFVIADVLVQADLFGVESHGVSRILKYTDLLERNVIQLDARLEIVKETELSAVLDAHSAMGQIAAAKAMQTAIEKAKKHGIGMVQLRNSNHYGIAGYYALLAAKEHMLGVSMTNSPAIMVPTFCAEALLGSNPIAFAMPAGKYPFLYDGATTVITRGKVELYQKTGKQLMDGWTVDETGKNEVRPDIILKNIREKTGGGILPVGGSGELQAGYKGYGYAMICEIMTSIFGGGVFSMHKKDQGDTSQCFYAMDYGMFGDKREIENRMETLITEIHHAKKEKGQQRIYTAGEKEFEREKEYKKSGIPVSEKTYQELEALGKRLGITM